MLEEHFHYIDNEFSDKLLFRRVILIKVTLNITSIIGFHLSLNTFIPSLDNFW